MDETKTTSMDTNEIKFTWKEKWQMLSTGKKVAIVAAGVCGIVGIGGSAWYLLSHPVAPVSVSTIVSEVVDDIPTVS